MKRNVLALVIGLLAIGGVAFLARSTDQRIEVNAVTGAVRTEMRYAYVFNTAWKVRSTWVEESAARQGILTDGGWQYLSVVSNRLFYTLNECGRAPVSYPLQSVDPEELNLKTTDEIDRFSRDFIIADEAQKAQMISTP